MFPILLMIAAGIGVAVAFVTTIGIVQRTAQSESQPANRDSLAASILFNLLLAGGDRPDEALRDIRREAGLVAPVASSIDVPSWATRFAQMCSAEQRQWLLDVAVRLVASRRRAVALVQYSMLLDLSFALGFQTDALAKLREQYGFDYIDHAKNARPREADRAGGSLPLFVREPRDAEALLSVLGMHGDVTRQEIISQYRKLASQHHPDRVFAQGQDAQSESAARFIEITRAYEALLAIYRE